MIQSALARLHGRLQRKHPLVLGMLRKFRGYHFQLAALEYPVDNDAPRYGYGKPLHAPTLAMIERSRSRLRETVASIVAAGAAFTDVPNADADGACWENGWFNGNDALTLLAFITRLRPKTYLEIGSGNSTRFARLAIDRAGLSTELVSIDPFPRADIDRLCDSVVRSSLESVDLATFDRLEAGDILSFDGSHRSFMNTDVTAFFLDVLPRLAAGVLIHVHDIYLPSDYPPGSQFLNEQYLLGTYLIASPDVEIVMPVAFVTGDDELGAPLRAFWRERGFDQGPSTGVGFWFRRAVAA